MPSPLAVFTYDDFDGNGVKEAFAVCAGAVDEESFGDDGPYYSDCQIWYADSRGAKLIKAEYNNFPLYGFSQELMAAGPQKLFNWGICAGGSGSRHLLFGVRHGKPYELKISGQYNVVREQDGAFVAEGSDLSKGWHDYPLFFYRFDEKKGEFVPAQPKDPKPVE